MTQILEVKQLSCIRQQKNIFADISFTLHAGELLLIQGENGSGKSSLLRLIAGLATPSSGNISWHHDYKREFHYVGHTNGIRLGLTVDENLKLFNVIATSAAQSDNDVFELRTIGCATASFLSSGQKRKLALAKLFLFPKPIWILDEPLTSLDANAQQLFLTELKTHLQQGGIAIISSHHEIEVEGVNLQRLRMRAC